MADLARKSTDDTASSSCSDDDLNSHPTVRKPARRFPTPPPAVASESDDDDDDDDLSFHPITKKTKRRHSRTPTPSPSPPPPAAKPARAVPHDSGHGDRIIMTDDEDDDAYAAFKAARVKARKKRTVSAKPTTTAKRRSVKQPAKGVVKWKFDDEEDDGGGIDENAALPGYLQSRKQELVAAKKALAQGDASTRDVFRIPPNYDDIEFSDDERLEYIESRPNFEKIAPCAPYEDVYMEESLGVIPCSIAQYLRSYQIEGTKFLHKNFVFQEGCILGDDMGLGKTVQVIAFLTAAFGKTGDERDGKRLSKVRRYNRTTGEDKWYPKALVICPSSLIDNWQQEFRTWGWWRVCVYHGSKSEKEDALDSAKAGAVEIMITNYDTYRLRCEDINQVHWDCVIADECHKVKERKSETTQRMNDINALCRIGLTGTAIQNKYEELWTLLNWCRPGAVGTLTEWEATIGIPLRLGQQHTATLGQIGRARRVASALVNNLLPRMFLRRMKALIQDQLPKKTDKVVFCPLTDLQKEAYENYLETPRIIMLKDGDEPCDCGKPAKRRHCCYSTDAEGRKINELVFPSIMWVQKLSNHLANWIPDNSDPDSVRAEKLELLQSCLPDNWRELSTRERLYNYMDPQMCGKWVILQKLLAFWHQSGDKVLIFSYSLNLLKILHELFRQTSYNVCYLDGAMPLPDRAKAVHDFNTDPAQFVFLISTKAGGVGLNITAANKVVIFDPNWNPSYDLQAQDRAYRIGQTRDVEVFRLVSAGTIEEIVYARQIYKQQQANIGYGASNERRYFSGVMGDKDNKGELFGLKNLFSFQDNAILQEIVNKTNVAERKAGNILVANLDGGGDDDEDTDLLDFDNGDSETAAVSQIASLATGKPDRARKSPTLPPAQSAISAILASAGVSYTHENSEVIGTSKVEAEISRKALKAAEDTQLAEVAAFAQSQGGQGGLRFNPPEEVRRRQFCEAARLLGFGEGEEAVRSFALVVEGWTQRRRREVLERFYELRRREVEGVGSDVEEVLEEEGASGEGVERDAGKVGGVKVEEQDTAWNMGDETIEISDDEL